MYNKMIMNNKKGSFFNILLIFGTILVFSLVCLITVIMGYLMFAIGNDYVVLPLYDVSQSFNYSTEFNEAYADVVRNYQGFDLGFIDDMWFSSYMILVMLSLVGAYQSKRMNNFAFLSMLTYGLMFVLYIAGFFVVVLNFLYYDLLLNLFTNLSPSTPKLEWFIINYGFQFLIHASALLLVKVLDFDFSFWRNRQKKEEQAFDDEIV